MSYPLITNAGLQLDAQAALDYVTSDPVLSLLPIVGICFFDAEFITDI